MKTFFTLASVGLLMAACTYHSASDEPLHPVTYESATNRQATSIGLLRRLAIMPIQIEPVRDEQASEMELEEKARVYESSCAVFLREKKGYDIVIARESDRFWKAALSAEENRGAVSDLYSLWQGNAPEDRTQAQVRKIGRYLDVDGLIVVQVKEREPWDGADGILNIFLMNIPLVIQMRTPDIGALIYETASGKMVWKTEQSTFGSETASTADLLTDLFFDMENAVPPQLIE